MNRSVSTRIDPERCIGCGLCVQVCPSGTLSIQDEKAVVTGNRSLACEHCAAVCPTEAVEVTAVDDDAFSFKTFEADEAWLPHGEYDTARLVRLMRSRRSCRNYTDAPVDRAVLEDLVRIGTTAPSGTNSQKWTFTILSDRQAVMALGERIGMFFRKLNQLAEKPLLRKGLKLIGKGQLDAYHREHYQIVRDALAEWERTGQERLFHGASSAIVVGSELGASCPMEDALLATQNILLAAHTMGLGTCLVGFAVEAMRNDLGIQRFIGIPDEESIYAVIAMGHPDETYQRPAGRRKVVPRHWHP